MYSLKQWEDKGRYYNVQGFEVFVVEEGVAEQTLVILHGYPSCSYDYWRVLPFLSSHFRVVIHDQLGFGLSAKPPNYSYSLIEQADIALELWQQLGIAEAHLLGHDYGTSVVTEMIARKNLGYEPVELLSATIGNGSMHIEMARLRPIQKLLRNPWLGPIVARLSNKAIFKRNMRKLWADPAKVKEHDLEVLWQMLDYNNGRQVFAQVSRYLSERRIFWHRWIGGLQKTGMQINICWAEEDPVAVVAMAHVLHDEIRNSRLRILPGIGHYPMLEAPEIWSEAIFQLIKSE